MFQRLALDDSAAIFTIVAFLCAATIYGMLTWRAIRMNRPDSERFSRLPFDSPTPDSRHDDAE